MRALTHAVFGAANLGSAPVPQPEYSQVSRGVAAGLLALSASILFTCPHMQRLIGAQQLLELLGIGHVRISSP